MWSLSARTGPGVQQRADEIGLEGGSRVADGVNAREHAVQLTPRRPNALTCLRIDLEPA